MNRSNQHDFIIGPDDLILVTGATGFIGSRLVQLLLDRGFTNVRCFARPSSEVSKLERLSSNGARVEVVRGNLASKEECALAIKNVAVVYHLAAGRGEKFFPDAFFNSVVTTRNLLEACRKQGSVRRFVNVSSFTVYSNRQKSGSSLLDESCPVDKSPELRGDAYSFAKIKQEEILLEYANKFRIPYVIVRPGYVYGPGNEGITGRVGIGTFGLFLHLGGSNTIPITYVDNCAEAIALTGLKAGVDGEIFNVVDDDLPSSLQFLRQYKRNVKSFKSIYVPHAVSYMLCYFWEKYSKWSERQLPPVFNRAEWHVSWKKTRYSNRKLKERLGWRQTIPTAEAMRRFFEACRNRGLSA